MSTLLLFLACDEPAPTDSALGTGEDCAALEGWLPDADGDGYGDDEAMRLTCQPPEGWTQVDGDCDDSDPGVHRDHADVCADGVDANCDGVDPAARTERAWGADEATWALHGDETSAHLGTAVAGMAGPGGLRQVLVGAPGGDAGAGYVLIAGDGAVGTPRRLTPTEGTDGSDFGYSLAVGDMTGDGAPDGIIGAPGGTGAVYLLDATTNEATLLLSGDPAGGSFGFALAAGIDATGDGVPDLAVSAALSGEEGAVVGGAWLVAGPVPAAADVVDVGVVVGAGAPGDGSGAAIDFVDTDGDGVAEVLMGVSGAEREGGAVGAVRMFRPGEDAPVATIWGEVADASFGAVAAGLGDYSGDGYEDVAIGEPRYVVSGASLGRAYVFLGPFDGDRDTAAAHLTVRGVEEGDYVGDRVGGADLTADGVPDFLVSGLAMSLDREEPLAGAVLAFTCGVGGDFLPEDADLAWAGEASVSYFGLAFTTVPDGDDDGFDDLLVGAPYWMGDPDVGFPGAAYILRR